MSVKIFRDDNWNRIKSGVISRKDIMGLDPEKDREMICFLIRHAPQECSMSMQKYSKEKYGMEIIPESPKNIDDPEDERYPEYMVLSEQVVREDDTEVLKAAALNSSDWNIAAFAFCRLTGYSWPPDECDAYSYRTYECGLKADMSEEDIKSFCQEMIERNGHFAKEAAEVLQSYRDHI